MLRFIAAAFLLAAPAAAEPICYAAGDRLARATVTLALADPEIAARATRKPTENSIRLMAADAAERMADTPGICEIILGLPESSVQSLARSFVEELRKDLTASTER